ncbi:hypothetical protein CDAR_304351 [Caerostris darwini]|uniref:Uncharacterized protein n=1 Tax=Caerostris darwini TaxID=1538125 RepID=A0AAV4P2I8_9ARAC|nr:hypothetical protein CDAR_304351 [Caerostris darwini]
MKTNSIPTGKPTKTQPKYQGTLIITDIVVGDNYRVTQLREKSKGHSYTTTALVSQLTAWSTQTDSNREDSSDDLSDFSDNELRDSELRCNPKACLY